MNTQEMSPRMAQAMKVAQGIAAQGDEIDRLQAVIDRQNEIIAAHENMIDSLHRAARMDAQRYTEIEDKNRRLERSNAILQSRQDDMRTLLNANDREMAPHAEAMTPEELMNPRYAQDEPPSERDMSGLFQSMERLLAENRPRESGEHTGGYVEQLDKSISHTADRSGLAEAAAESSESVKP